MDRKTIRLKDGMVALIRDEGECSKVGEAIDRLADLEDKIERGELVERSSGCCWCVADDIQNKTYIRTGDTEYNFIAAAFCPKCGRGLEDE